MPRKYLMTWEPSKTRWRKMHRGKVFTISCEALGAPPNKEQSYRLANEWWERQVSSISPASTKYDPIIVELVRRKSWLVQQGRNEEAAGYDKLIEVFRKISLDTSIITGDLADFMERNLGPILGVRVPGTVLSPDEIRERAGEIYTPAFHVWQDRLSRFTPPPAERTVGHWVKKFLAMRETEVKSGDLSISNYDSIRLCLNTFRDWLGADAPVDVINAEKWVGWYMQVQASEVSVGYKRKRFIFARSFVGFLVEQGLIPGFPSLYARRFKFGGSDHEVAPLAVDEVRNIVTAAPGILKLFIMLMLNTGMTQKDISDLKPDEYRDGRVTRRRSKTRRRNTRVVSWQLWDCTRALLDQHKQDGPRLLLTARGKPWVRDELVDGKRKKCDSIKSIYRETKIGVPLHRLRQTSGDRIRRKFGQHVADHFLAHGQGVVDQAYFSRDQAELDEAVEWLRREYGL